MMITIIYNRYIYIYIYVYHIISVFIYNVPQVVELGRQLLAKEVRLQALEEQLSQQETKLLQHLTAREIRRKIN